ncbi:MAG: ABC transporter ATP-binding protein [Verrucomicrobiales bacterium]|nr:ABC transporter ATP-binding protein [Verrucomicrobiales bacterium]
MIAATGISKSFGRVRALDEFTVKMPAGRAFSLIGPNGSGKTTFLKCLLGTVIPDRGTLTLDGHDLLASPEPRGRIGYMPQIGRYPDNLRVGQIFEMLTEIRDAGGGAPRRDTELIEAFDIEKIAQKPMRTLSGGTRQKVSACVAFLFNPDVLVLDEPTAGLDPVSVEILKEKVLAERKRGKLILLTSHILSDLDEITTDVLFLIEGRLRFSRPLDELRAESGEEKLGRLIARIMLEEAHSPSLDPAP